MNEETQVEEAQVGYPAPILHCFFSTLGGYLNNQQITMHHTPKIFTSPATSREPFLNTREFCTLKCMTTEKKLMRVSNQFCLNPFCEWTENPQYSRLLQCAWLIEKLSCIYELLCLKTESRRLLLTPRTNCTWWATTPKLLLDALVVRPTKDAWFWKMILITNVQMFRVDNYKNSCGVQLLGNSSRNFHYPCQPKQLQRHTSW